MAQQRIPPPQRGMSAYDYYRQLTGMGIGAYDAYQATSAAYGPPKSPQQQQADQAAANSRSNLAAQVGQVGGLIGGAALADYAFADKTPAAKGPSTEVPPKATLPSQTQAPQSSPTAGGSPAVEVGSTTMPDGTRGTLMSDGAKVGDNGKIVNPDGTDGGSFSGQALAGLQTAGGVAQMYNGYRQYQSGEKLGGAANIAGGAYATAAGAQSLAAGGVAGSLAEYVPAAGAVVAGAQIGQQMMNEKGSSEDRAAKSQYEAQKAALLFIPGYGWAAYGTLALADALSGGRAGNQIMRLNKNIDKFNDRIDFGLGKSIRSKVFHQSTKGVQEMHTGQLMQQSDDPQWQNYVAGMRAQVKDGPKDKTKPFAGQYATFDEYKKAGLRADDLTGVYGNLDAFKPDYAEVAGVPDWSKLNFQQQQAVTQRLIDADLYSSKKGEVIITDKDKARAIYEDMAKTNFGVPLNQKNQPAAVVVKPNQGEVSRVSPGMYMNDQGQVRPAQSIRSALEMYYKK